ncbi:aminotransferase class I/II-fold pyridoxal phosphate-dependent enzyme [Micromonospora soli]|uniref:aminotransferase class I/II-fold pyridoxal phosphate-dependent enzyme n=1 Tax=Micromonospora sp. NBRC 110009 TaxID=3061627 RepID=UPI0026723FE3|nr:aminotransferase class I/II-fold pyridoxal phosphate-dependent enzyme [Micromonospora sp. NBRC 110009]WKT99064.1 aminotransferase class I/II-fold pyridoxal phosphate-dependent enzyme [Micromonospora sp. NBRC 110009]
MTDPVLLSPPDVGPLEESYVLDALRSGWVAPVGPHVAAFEREVAQRVGCGHAVALASGTAGLHLALLALGAGPGDVVVVPTLTFVATANAVRYTGAEPVFVDCEPTTGNLDPALLHDLLRDLRRQGRRVAAVMPVDMFGACADYARILPVCAEAEVAVVEDAAEALGSVRDGRAAGSFGRAGVLSFNGNKIMTTSGGGMLLSDDAELTARCRYLSTQARQPVPYYEHTEVGFNYRLSNVLAALGRAQLRRLDDMVTRRRQLRERYAKLFAAVPGVRLLADQDPGANCWLTTIIVDPVVAGWRAGELAAHLGAHRIETRPVWKPMHLQPVFAGAGARLTGAAERLFADGLNLPSGSAMSEGQVVHVLDRIEDFLSARSERLPLLIEPERFAQAPEKH